MRKELEPLLVLNNSQKHSRGRWLRYIALAILGIFGIIGFVYFSEQINPSNGNKVLITNNGERNKLNRFVSHTYQYDVNKEQIPGLRFSGHVGDIDAKKSDGALPLCQWWNKNDHSFLLTTSEHTPYRLTFPQYGRKCLGFCFPADKKKKDMAPLYLFERGGFRPIRLYTTDKKNWMNIVIRDGLPNWGWNPNPSILCYIYPPVIIKKNDLVRFVTHTYQYDINKDELPGTRFSGYVAKIQAEKTNNDVLPLCQFWNKNDHSFLLTTSEQTPNRLVFPPYARKCFGFCYPADKKKDDMVPLYLFEKGGIRPIRLYTTNNEEWKKILEKDGISPGGFRQVGILCYVWEY